MGARGGGESSWRSGPVSLLGTASWAGLDWRGTGGRRTTAGRVTGCWRTAGAACETGWATTAGCRAAAGGDATTGGGAAAGCCTGAGPGAGTRFGCCAGAGWLTGLAWGTSGSTGGVWNIPAVAAANTTTVAPLATRATTVLRRLNTIPPTPCQLLYFPLAIPDHVLLAHRRNWPPSSQCHKLQTTAVQHRQHGAQRLKSLGPITAAIVAQQDIAWPRGK
jgi:hypothetical protein